MKNTYWIAIAVAALIVGVLVGYGFWGSSAGRLPEVEKEVSSFEGQLADLKKKHGDLEANLGKVTNEKLILEKEIAELKEAQEKAAEKRR